MLTYSKRNEQRLNCEWTLTRCVSAKDAFKSVWVKVEQVLWSSPTVISVSACVLDQSATQVFKPLCVRWCVSQRKHKLGHVFVLITHNPPHPLLRKYDLYGGQSETTDFHIKLSLRQRKRSIMKVKWKWRAVTVGNSRLVVLQSGGCGFYSNRLF